MNNTIAEILTSLDKAEFKDTDWLFKMTIDGLSVNRNSSDVADIMTEAPINSDVHYYATKLLELPLQYHPSKWDVDDLTMTGASSQYLNSVEHFWGAYIHYLNALIHISELTAINEEKAGEAMTYIPHMVRVGRDVLVSAKGFSGLLTTCEDRKQYTLELKSYCSAIDHAREIVTTWLSMCPDIETYGWLVSHMCSCGWTVEKHQARTTCSRCGTQPTTLDLVIRKEEPFSVEVEFEQQPDAEVVDINEANNGTTGNEAARKPYYKSIDSLIQSDAVYEIYPNLSVKREDMVEARLRLMEVDCPKAVDAELESELIGLLGEYANVLGSSRDLLFITQAQHEWCVAYTLWIHKALDIRVTQLLTE